MVLWKETAFPLCRAMERRWKRNVVSQVSSVIVVICLPISCVSSWPSHAMYQLFLWQCYYYFSAVPFVSAHFRFRQVDDIVVRCWLLLHMVCLSVYVSLCCSGKPCKNFWFDWGDLWRVDLHLSLLSLDRLSISQNSTDSFLGIDKRIKSL